MAPSSSPGSTEYLRAPPGLPQYATNAVVSPRPRLWRNHYRSHCCPGPHKIIWQVSGALRTQPDCRGRPGSRLPGSQRGRENHRDSCPAGPNPRRRWNSNRPRARPLEGRGGASQAPRVRSWGCFPVAKYERGEAIDLLGSLRGGLNERGNNSAAFLPHPRRGRESRGPPHGDSR